MIQRKYSELLKENRNKFIDDFMNGIIEEISNGRTIVIALSSDYDTKKEELAIINYFYEEYPNSKNYIIIQD